MLTIKGNFTTDYKSPYTYVISLAKNVFVLWQVWYHMKDCSLQPVNS